MLPAVLILIIVLALVAYFVSPGLAGLFAVLLLVAYLVAVVRPGRGARW